MGSLPWDMIGAIIGGLSFLLTLIVEWDKLEAWRRIIIALVIGVGAFIVINLFAPLLFPPQEVAPTEILPAATETATSFGQLIYDENFNDGTDDGFFYENGNWSIVDDGSGNKVLESGKSNNWSYARFGPTNFSNGTIEYRVRLTEYDSSNYSGLAFLIFREQPQASYIFASDYKYLTLDFKYTGDDTSYKWTEIDNGTTSFDLQKNKWYSVRVTVSGNRILVYLDQRLAIDTTDSRLTNGKIKFGSASFSTVAQFDDVRVWFSEQ
jgi:hypothetical protein